MLSFCLPAAKSYLESNCNRLSTDEKNESSELPGLWSVPTAELAIAYTRPWF